MATKTTAPVPADELSPAAKRRAVDAIQRIHELFYVKGGIRDTAQKLHTKQEEAGRLIYGLAKYAAEAETKPVRQMALFRGLCRYAEQSYKERENVNNLAEALPVWRVYKSNILKGVRLGFDPKDYETEYELRKAVAEELRGDGHNGDGTQQQRQLGAQKLLPGLPGRLKPLMVRALEQVQHVPKDRSKDAEDLLRKFLEELEQLGHD